MKKGVMVLVLSLLLSLLPVMAGALDAEVSLQGRELTLQGRLNTNQNTEVTVLIKAPDGSKVLGQDTCSSDGSFRFSMTLPADAPQGGYQVTINARGESEPVLLHFSYGSNAQSAQRFADVPLEHWAAAYIETLAAQGLVEGADGCFEPERSVTAAELLKMGLSALLGFAPTQQSDPWYAPWTEYAEQIGLTDGIFSDSYDQPATREQAAAFLYRAAVQAGLMAESSEGVLAYPDTSQVSSFAVEAVSALSQAGILSGTTDGRLDPAGMLTRAQLTKMIVLLGGFGI